MHLHIYRACPVCRNTISQPKYIPEKGQKWHVFICANCGSEIWILPFKEILDKKQ